MPDVTMPSGFVVHNVPAGTTKEDLLERLHAGGYDTKQLLQPREAAPAERSMPAILGSAFTRGVGHIIGGLATPLEDAPRLVGYSAEEAKKMVAPAAEALRGADKGITDWAGQRATPDWAHSQGFMGGLASIAETAAEGAPATVAAAGTALLTKNPYAAMAVMGLASGPQSYSGIKERQKAQGVDDPLTALAGAAASTAFDMYTGLGGQAAGLGKHAAFEIFEKGMGAALKHIAKTGAEEGVTEVLQNVIEQGAGHTNPLTKQSLMESAEAGLAGILGGGVFGTVAHGATAYSAAGARKQFGEAPALHTVEVERKIKGETVVQPFDILSAPTEKGEVIARAPSGQPFRTTLEELEKRRPAPAEGEEPHEPLAATLAPLVEARNAEIERQKAADAMTAHVAGDQPLQGPEFEEKVTAFAQAHGFDQDTARNAIMQMTGGTQAAAPPTYTTGEAPPTAQTVQPDPGQAPGINGPLTNPATVTGGPPVAPHVMSTPETASALVKANMRKKVGAVPVEAIDAANAEYERQSAAGTFEAGSTLDKFLQRHGVQAGARLKEAPPPPITQQEQEAPVEQPVVKKRGKQKPVAPVAAEMLEAPPVAEVPPPLEPIAAAPAPEARTPSPNVVEGEPSVAEVLSQQALPEVEPTPVAAPVPAKPPRARKAAAVPEPEPTPAPEPLPEPAAPAPQVLTHADLMKLYPSTQEGHADKEGVLGELQGALIGGTLRIEVGGKLHDVLDIADNGTIKFANPKVKLNVSKVAFPSAGKTHTVEYTETAEEPQEAPAAPEVTELPSEPEAAPVQAEAPELAPSEPNPEVMQAALAEAAEPPLTAGKIEEEAAPVEEEAPVEEAPPVPEARLEIKPKDFNAKTTPERAAANSQVRQEVARALGGEPAEQVVLRINGVPHQVVGFGEGDRASMMALDNGEHVGVVRVTQGIKDVDYRLQFGGEPIEQERARIAEQSQTAAQRHAAKVEKAKVEREAKRERAVVNVAAHTEQASAMRRMRDADKAAFDAAEAEAAAGKKVGDVETTAPPEEEPEKPKAVNKGSQGKAMGAKKKATAAGMLAQQELGTEIAAHRTNRKLEAGEVRRLHELLRTPETKEDRAKFTGDVRTALEEQELAQRNLNAAYEKANSTKGAEAKAAVQAEVKKAETAYQRALTARVARVRDVMDEMLAARGAGRATASQSTEDPDPAFGAKMQEALQGKTMRQAARWAADNAPDEATRVLAESLYRQLARMEQAGIKFDFKVLGENELPKGAPLAIHDLLAQSRGLVHAPLGGAPIRLFLHGADVTGRSGMAHGLLLHELLHAVTSGGIHHIRNGGARGTPLARNARALIRAFEDVAAHVQAKIARGAPLTELEQEFVDGKNNAFADADELLTWTFTDPRMRAYLTKEKIGPHSLWRRVVAAVRKFVGASSDLDPILDRVMGAGTKLINAPAELLKEANDAAPGDVATAVQQINRGTQRAQQASDAEEFRQGFTGAAKGWIDLGSDMNKARVSGFTTRQYQARVPFTTTSEIKEMVRRLSKPAGAVLDRITVLHEKQRAMATQMRKAMSRKVAAFQKVKNKIGVQGMKAFHAMTTTARINRHSVHDFTSRADALVNDPVMKRYAAKLADPKYTTKGVATGVLKRRTDKINAVWDAWDALGKFPGAQEQYVKVRQFYKEMYAVLQTTQHSIIDMLDISDAEKAKLKKGLDGKGESEFDEEYPSMRTDELPTEYFPFRRFGDYALIIKGSKKPDSVRERYHFDTPSKRDAFSLAKKAEARKAGMTEAEITDRFEHLNGLDDIRNSISSNGKLINDLNAKIDNIPITGDSPQEIAAFRNRLKDVMWQSYLLTLPERSIRKQLIHAEFVPGHSADPLLVFRATAQQYANTLPKMVYGKQIDRQIETLATVIKSADQTKDANAHMLARDYVRRLRETEEVQQQSTGERILSAVTFTSLMTSMASAVVQPLVLPFQVLPRMMMRYNTGHVLRLMAQSLPRSGAIKAFIEVDPVTGEKWLRSPSMGNTDHVKKNPLRRRFWAELNDKRDLFSHKQTDSLLQSWKTTFGPLSGLREGGPTHMLSKVANLMAAPFTAADQLAREASGMAFAELEYEKLKKQGKNDEEAFAGAVASAVRDTEQTVGNFTPLERPDIFRGSAGKRALGFLRNYSMQRQKYYWQTVRALAAGSPYATRKQLFGELASVMLFQAAGAGLGSVFGYTFVTQAINLIYPFLFSKEENDRRRREDPLGADDADYRFRHEWIPQHFGAATGIAQHGALSEATGWDIGSRLAQNQLWLRGAKSGDTWAETVRNWVDANLSPHLSSSSNMVSSIDDFLRGDFDRGFAKLVPAAFRGVLTAKRLAREGERSPVTGKQIMEDFTPGELAGQVVGFTPSRLADQRDVNRAKQGWQQRAGDARQKVIDDFKRIILRPESTSDTMEAWVKRYDDYQASAASIAGVPGAPISKLAIEPEDLASSLQATILDQATSEHGVSMTPEEWLIFMEADSGGQQRRREPEYADEEE